MIIITMFHFLFIQAYSATSGSFEGHSEKSGTPVRRRESNENGEVSEDKSNYAISSSKNLLKN